LRCDLRLRSKLMRRNQSRKAKEQQTRNKHGQQSGKLDACVSSRARQLRKTRLSRTRD
jgi:hypothetical protein